MGSIIHGPGGAVKLYFSVPVELYTVFWGPKTLVRTLVKTLVKKPDQKSDQKPGQKSGQKSAQNLAKIRACRACIDNPGVQKK